MTVVDDSRSAVVLVAAGEGTRLGYGMPKAFVPLAGRTLLRHAVDGVAKASRGFRVVVVVPGDLVDRAARQLPYPALRVVAGGSTRRESVEAGLRALPDDTDLVLVHDAARALTPPELIDRVADAVDRCGHGVIPGLALADSIKRTDAGMLAETLDRSGLSAVQTPQGFPFERLRNAYAEVTAEHPDDAAVFAEAGGDVAIIPGEQLAFKITTPADLVRAETVLSGSAAVRTGVGVDVHAFGESGELRLAGLSWPGVPALAGHSDGDAVAHAVCDALLSAAGLGDIGGRFGTADPRYADAAGSVFLEATTALLAESGHLPVNVAVQIIGSRPRFAPRRDEAQDVLTALVGAPVSVAATTTDGLGFTGRHEGIAVIATALVRRIGGGAQ